MNKFDVILDECDTENHIQTINKANHAVLLLTESNLSFIYILQNLAFDIYQCHIILNDKSIEKAKQIIDKRLSTFSVVQDFCTSIIADTIQIQLMFVFDTHYYNARLMTDKTLYNCIQISFNDINTLFDWQTINVFSVQFAQYEITTTATTASVDDSLVPINRAIVY